ncbi:hypothetical protein, partial [Porphyromonas levii]|uniref:hypothetical protein n=1 Tax=Porphyromonas levii TaxID=28114 RepID=UPI001BA8A361
HNTPVLGELPRSTLSSIDSLLTFYRGEFFSGGLTLVEAPIYTLVSTLQLGALPPYNLLILYCSVKVSTARDWSLYGEGLEFLSRGTRVSRQRDFLCSGEDLMRDIIILIRSIATRR